MLKLWGTRAIGVLNIGMSLLGLYITAYDGLIEHHPRLFAEHPVAVRTMLFTSTLLLMSLSATGLLLLRNPKWAAAALAVYGLELLYFVGSSFVPRELGGAFAVGTSGFYPQLTCVFPIWAAPLLYWCTRRNSARASG